MARPKWATTLATALGFQVDDEELEKSATPEGDGDDIQKARRVPPVDDDEGDEDEELDPPSQEDAEQGAAPEKPAAPAAAGAPPEGDTDEDEEPEDDDSDEEDDDDENVKERIVRSIDDDPDLLKSIMVDRPDILKSLFEGEQGEQVAALIDASDTMAYVVDRFDSIVKSERKTTRLVIKSMSEKIDELSEGIGILAKALEVIGGNQAELVKSQTGTRRSVVPSGLDALRTPVRTDPAQEPAEGKKPKRGKATLSDDERNTLLKSRLVVRNALMRGVENGKISDAKAGDLIGRLGTAEGIRATLDTFVDTDAEFFKSQEGLEDLIKAS